MNKRIVIAVAAGAISLMSVVPAVAKDGVKAGQEGSEGNRGLCNAWAHNNQKGKDNGQAFVRLAETAGGADNVADFCLDLYPEGPSTPRG
jgi:hypothetical protein